MNNEIYNEDVELSEAWKVYGMETEAGRELRKLFGYKNKPKIEYPKIIIKKRKTETETLKPEKKKIIIEYPKITKHQKIKKIPKVDLIPKRRKFEEIKLTYIQILKEIKELKLLQKPSQNRDKMKEKLQNINKYKNTSNIMLTPEEEANILKKVKYKYNISNNKNNELEQFKNKTEKEKLNEYFEYLISDIDYRMDLLNQLKDSDNSELKDKIKNEVVCKVSELQKITELIKK